MNRNVIYVTPKAALITDQWFIWKFITQLISIGYRRCDGAANLFTWGKEVQAALRAIIK